MSCRLYVATMLHDKEELICPACTLSQVIAKEGLDHIHLLKIDVERAELEVLAGLQQADWPRVQQVVAEVHDIDSRVRHLQALLNRHGLQTLVDQAPELTGSTLFTIYASRQQLH